MLPSLSFSNLFVLLSLHVWWCGAKIMTYDDESVPPLFMMLCRGKATFEVQTKLSGRLRKSLVAGNALGHKLTQRS